MIKLHLSQLTALLLTINLTNGQTSTEKDTTINHPKHLSLEQLTLLLDSEAQTDYDSSSSALLSKSIWEDANRYEWSKGLAAAEQSDQKYPYLICHGGSNLSGWQRRLVITSALANSTIDLTNNNNNNITKEEEEYYLHTLYNTDDYLCVYGQLMATNAMKLQHEDIVVQPIMTSLKMIGGAVEGMREEYGSVGAAAGYFPRVDVGLCPGVAVDDDDESSVGESYEFVMGSDGKIVDEGDDMKSVEDITDKITKLLLSASSANTNDGVNSSEEVLPLPQEYYMTSKAYQDQLVNSTTVGENDEQSARSKMWGNLLDEYHTSGKCDETYTTRLKWKMYRSTQPERYASQMEVVYNNTGETDTDASCALVLLLAISAHPDVCSVDVRRGVQTSNQIASFMMESEIENQYPFRAKGIDGTGETVTISDTGVDQDNCYFFDPTNEQPVGFRFDSSSRKVDQYVPFADTADLEYGHGTHVAGTLAGKRYDTKGAADGIAPGVTLAVADIGNRNGDLFPPNDSALLRTGLPRSRVHSASWGSNFNFYTSRARNFDQFMFENDEFLIIVAAGNSGSEGGAIDIPNTVGDPATAKNVIAVGAHNSYGHSKSAGALGPSYIADFSSRGPSLDGRMKPDIMAAGKFMLSAGADPNVVGECDPSRIPGPNSRGGGLLSLQGTSMATPVVSGTAAIVRQYFSDGYYPSGMKNSDDAYPNPSGALIKAVLMNGAQNLKGVDNGRRGVTDVKLYDNNQGFGRLSLQNSVYLVGETNVQLQIWDRQSVKDRDTNTYEVTIDKSNGCQAEDLSVTLAWVEEGSSPGCMSCVINDLDLSISLRGQTYYPNGRNLPDRKNIVERVIINGVMDGETATISVNAYNLAWQSQRYALVATGCFGGVANTLEGESVFDADNSRQRRRAIAISTSVIVCLLLLGCVTYSVIRRRKVQLKLSEEMKNGVNVVENNGIDGGEVEERA